MESSVEAQAAESVRVGIREVLDDSAYRLVGAYYAAEPVPYGATKDVLFAGRYFDELPGNEPGAFSAGDLAAASLLDVRFGPHAVLRLLQRGDCNKLLAEIPPDVPLWEAPDELLGPDGPAWALWDELRAIPGVGRTRASKLLARKRPQLMPILDKVIVRALNLEDVDAWQALRLALTPELRERIDALAPAATDQGATTPTTLRLLDIATWMQKSQSRQAKAVRSLLAP